MADTLSPLSEENMESNGMLAQQCQTNGVSVKMNDTILDNKCNGCSNKVRRASSCQQQPQPLRVPKPEPQIHLESHRRAQPSQSKWSQVSPSLISIAIYNLNSNHRNDSNRNQAIYLNFHLGDLLIIVEHNGPWYRGYADRDVNKALGIFPANYVQVFDAQMCKPLDTPNCSYLSSYFYILLDPLFLQLIRSLRDWQQCLFQLYRDNNDPDRFMTVVQLMRECIGLASTLSRDLAPALWRKRSSRSLKLNTNENSSGKDPFGGLDEEEHACSEHSLSDTATLEEIYEKVLRRLNKGNYLLDMDIMPSFTHSALGLDLGTKRIFDWNRYRSSKTGKFRPYNSTSSSRYLTHVLNYYNRLKRNYKHLGNKSEALYDQCPSSPQAFLAEKAKKCRRRHLLLSMKEVNFTSLFNICATETEHSPILQIDVHVLRTKAAQPNDNGQQYEIVSEKYCYRIRANGQIVTSGTNNVSRALFVDILSKKSSNANHSMQSDSLNYYLVIQVWRYGRMHVENKCNKNMLSSGSSLTAGSSVFHTTTSSLASSSGPNSISTSSSTSLSTLTSFVSNSSFFGDKNSSSNSAETTSIDSSEFGALSFKRSVGFSVISFQDLVSCDQELKSFMGREGGDHLNEDFITRLLLNDETTLPINVKLYEGDFTMANLETMLKWACPTPSMTTSNSLTLPNSLPNISKLPLLGNVQLSVCAKYLSEYLEPNSMPKADNNRSTMMDRGASMSDSMISSLSSYGGIALIKKRSFGDMLTAGQFRNDLYLTLDSADFDKGGKAIGKNIEVSVCLITENGIHERAISSGANDESVTIYRSHIQYHQNAPKWFEQIKVNVPLELFETAHLRFTFAHCSSKERERKLIGFSFLPLANKNGACIPDGEHELYIYKCDNERRLDEASFYLHQVAHGLSSELSIPKTLSASSTNISSPTILLSSRSSKEIFHIRTNLVSSKLTQNADILSLLKHNSTLSPQVIEALQRIGRVPGEEMVKFLEDILDSLFALFTLCLNSPSTACIESPQIALIFKVLVDFLRILNEAKYVSYLSALETYVAEQFSAPLVHSGLMECVRHHVQIVISSFQGDNNMSGGKKRELEFCLRCLSVLDWLLKMIVQSRLLYNKATGSAGSNIDHQQITLPQTNHNFMADLWTLFGCINHLLAVESKSSDDYLIIAIQESVLSAMPNSFFYLSKMLSPLELTRLIQSIVHYDSRVSIDWTPTAGHVSSSFRRTITDAKLLLFQTSIRCKYIWLHDEARLELLYTFVRLFNSHIAESKCCLKILEDILLYLTDKSQTLQDDKQRQQFEREIDMLSIGIYESFMEHIIKLVNIVSNTFELLSKKSEFVVEEDYFGKLITCFILMLDFLSLKNYEKLFEHREANHCKSLINNIFVVFLNALYYFADNWLEIKMELNRIILDSLIFLKTIMARKFLGSDDKFDVDIWKTFFKLTTAFLTQSRLQSDGLPLWKQRLILDLYGGDLRIIMARELIDSWTLVEHNKNLFVPSMVSAFVDAILVPQRHVRCLIIPIFFDMLAIDYQCNANIYQVESQLISRLDSLARKVECDAHLKELFTQILFDQIEKNRPVWYVDGIQFVKSISRQLALLIDYRNELNCKLKGTSEVDDRLLMSTYSLVRFYQERSKSADCQSIMLHYVGELLKLHLALENYTEAAFAFHLQSELLSWSPENVTKKEQLYEKMLSLFEKGKCWEEGLKICKQLESVYHANYKYKKLSNLLRRRAQMLDNILNVQRADNEYFRVSFYGLDFPSFLQNTTFIFRGCEFEKLPSFIQRIELQFPAAQLLTKIPSDEDIMKSNSQYIQIFSVKPISEPPTIGESALIFGQPDDVFSFYNTNFVRKFIQDRPIQRGAVDKNNEFKSLWIERTIFTIEKHLPGLLKAFELSRTPQTIFVSPIENACETIEKMNAELSKLVSQYNNGSGQSESLSPLSMRLQGILEAAVNGGISKYIEAFLSTNFLTSNPDQMSNVSRLKNLICVQCKTVENGLMVHGQLAPPSVRPLHSRLLERFSTMRSMIHEANHETAQAMLWTNGSTQPSITLTMRHASQRPSILSQPLPPIPSKQHEASDMDSSSQSSSSSLTFANSNVFEFGLLPPKTLGSPSKVTHKSRTFSAFLSSDETSRAVHDQHLKTKAMRSLSTAEESIYSMPQLPECFINHNNNKNGDNESSVDDTFEEYIECQMRHIPPTDSNGTILRSRSIPRQTLMITQTSLDANGHDNQTKSPIDAPPPLPPRASTLDRSNSLNSDVRRFPVIPPALPKRPARNSSTCLAPKTLNGEDETHNNMVHHSSPDQFISGLDNEFGNLVISSPTPRCSETGQALNNRPVPIIGIELNTDHVTPLVSLVNNQSGKIQETRSKSSSLPRMQQFISSPCSKANVDR